MTRVSREYLSSQVSSDPLEAQERVWELEDALKELSKVKRISALARALLKPEDVDEEGLDLEEVLKFCSGVLPALFLNVTYPDDEVTSADLAVIEARFDLHLFRTARELLP